MKTKKCYICLFLVIGIMLTCGTSAHALFGGKVESFSADQVVIAPDGKEMGTARLYVTPDAQRMDGIPGGGPRGQMMNMTIISFKNQNKQYIYNHDKKLVYDANIDEAAMMKDLKAYENVDETEVLGKEKVSGYSCVKKRITTASTIMGIKTTATTILWQSDKIDFPLRIKSENGGMSELRNIDTDEPSKKLFEPLPGYKEVGNLMAVMGMDFTAMAREDNDAMEDAADDEAPRTDEVSEEEEDEEGRKFPFKIPEGLKKFNPFGKKK